MMRKHVGLLTLVAAVSMAACGDDPVSVGDLLTEAEAAALGEVIFASALNNVDASPDPSMSVVGGPRAVPVSFTEDVQLTGQCELDGTVDIDASFSYQGDTETEAFSVDYTATLVHDDCAAVAETNEQEFVLNGAPSLVFAFSLATDGESFELSGGMDGNIAWESGDRSGECLVEVEFAGDANQFGEGVTSGSFSFDGSICGNEIESELLIG